MSMFSLCKIQQVPLDRVKTFVFNNEIYGIQLAERLEQYSSFVKENKEKNDKAEKNSFSGEFLCLLEENTLRGVVFVSKVGLVLTCIPQNLPESIMRGMIPPIVDWFLGKKVYCISGWSRGVQLIRTALELCSQSKKDDCNRHVVEHRRYHFMCYDARRCRKNLIPQFQVLRCGTQDLEGLYHLQSAYDTVEVLPKNYPFKPETCRVNLQRILELGNVVAIAGGENNEKFVAKANFSAVSWRFALIGGVFTMKSYRKRGCAGRLVQWMGDEATKSQRQAVLFVREENLAARHAYENAGYFFSGNYEIVYY